MTMLALAKAAPTRRPAGAAREAEPRQAASTPHAAAGVLQRCACGGGCPRCRAAAARPALAINTPGDAHEREADRVADAVVSGAPASASIRGPSAALQRCACGGACPACRAKQQGEEDLQREATGGSAQPGLAPPVVHDVLASPGQALDPRTRGLMESRIGADFAGVRVHTNGRAAESARAVEAHAYTVGRDVVFGAGAYQPGTARGDRLIAHELAHVVQQRGGVARVQRACGHAAVGTTAPPGCVLVTLPPPAKRFLFNVNCDEFAPGEEARLRAFAHTLTSGTTVSVLGMASHDGLSGFNEALSCRRADRAAAVLASEGVTPTAVRATGSVLGTAGDITARAVGIQVTTPHAPQPTTATHHSFRVAAVSFLSCALCNPFTDDGTLGVTPPTTEPFPPSSFRQKHHIEAELTTFDGRTIAAGGARLLGSGHNVGLSGFCGVSTRAHVVGFAAPGAPTRIVSPAHGEGIELESELMSRVGAVVPPTLPGSPCGFLGTHPLIPVIRNRFRLRLFADGTRESVFVSASLYPSHFLYEDGTLKLFAGAPVHPAIDFVAWASSTAPLAVGLVGFKALRSACCHPTLSSLACDTLCLGGFSAPGLFFNPAACAAHGAALALGSCPSSCAPAGGSCTPLMGPSNP